MWKPVELPYKSSTAAVTLPTTAEILACSTVVHERLAAKVVAVNERLVAKFGRGVDAWEGQALIYLERHVPDVPAPRLYAMYHDAQQLFLVMQRAPGEQLDRLWPPLTAGEKESITSQLRRIFDCLRQAPCPWPNFFGGLDGGAVHHYLFYSQKGDDENHMGPFSGEEAFVKGLTDNFRALAERNNHPVYKVQFYETHLNEVLQGHRPTLTHGDLQRKNIMVAVENGSCSLNGGERSFEIVLVDWEMAGWLPDFWEYFCASTSFVSAGWDDDWCWRTGHFLPVCFGETAVMRELDRDMGP